ncbi:MAG: hypothetical protein MI919_16755, partial [Holophagales bacterium]|nr:hypothetical protein [Holophagales bacterium]
EAALSTVGKLGGVLAGKMMQLFEQPDDKLGEMAGNLVGNLLVEAVLAFFTAGSANAVSAISKVARLLAKVGKHMLKILKQLAGLFKKFLKYIGKLAKKFKKAGSSAGGILGKIRGFFKRIAAWFRKMFRKFFKRKPSKRRAKRQWKRVVRRMRGVERNNRKKGITRSALASKVRSLRGANRLGVASARVKARPKRKEPVWKVSARAKVGVARLTGKRFEVLVDGPTRWKLGKKAIRKRLRKVSGKDTNPAKLKSILAPYEKRFRYESLRVEKDAAEKDFNIMGVMNPSGEVAEVDDLEGLHTGDAGDPIPLHWYKAPGDYPGSITLLRDPDDPTSQETVSMVGGFTLESRGKEERIGINGGNMVSAGSVLNRTKSGKRSSATSTFFSLLRRHGVNLDLSGYDADHVKDLGFGGADRRTNLWPLVRGVNQRASTMGHWYSRTNMEFIDEKGGKPKRAEKKLSSSKLRGKSFKIVGFQYPPPNPGGRDKK